MEPAAPSAAFCYFPRWKKITKFINHIRSQQCIIKSRLLPVFTCRAIVQREHQPEMKQNTIRQSDNVKYNKNHCHPLQNNRRYHHNHIFCNAFSGINISWLFLIIASLIFCECGRGGFIQCSHLIFRESKTEVILPDLPLRSVSVLLKCPHKTLTNTNTIKTLTELLF